MIVEEPVDYGNGTIHRSMHYLHSSLELPFEARRCRETLHVAVVRHSLPAMCGLCTPDIIIIIIIINRLFWTPFDTIVSK